jgi:hypothetical protein
MNSCRVGNGILIRKNFQQGPERLVEWARVSKIRLL